MTPNDVIGLAGLGFIIAGVAAIWWPLGLIALGLVLVRLSYTRSAKSTEAGKG